MAPPNSWGQMLNFGTSIKKFQLGPSEKIAFEVIVWFYYIAPQKITKNPYFAKFHPLDQGRAQIDIKGTWRLWKHLSSASKKMKFGQPTWPQWACEDGWPRHEILAFTK